MPEQPDKITPNVQRVANRDGMANWMKEIERLPEVRADKIHAARRVLEEDGYDNDRQVIDTTIDRLFEEIAVS